MVLVQFLGGPAGSTLTIANNLSQSRSGWTLGAGVEYAFAPNWSAFVEYNHFDFGNKDLNTIACFYRSKQLHVNPSALDHCHRAL